jgi:hypothetical protein
MLTLRASSEDAGREFVPVLEKMLASAKAVEEPPLTPEQQYYAEVREARALTEARMGAFGAIFSQVYQTRALLMGALLRAGVGTAFIDSVEALEKIDPPDRFVPEHRVVLDGYRELARLDDEARQAVEATDMAGFVLTNGRLGEVGAGIPLWLSAEFCHEVLRDSPLCSPLQSPPGGAYGGQLFESLRLLEADLAGPNGAMAFPLSLNPEENLAVFNEVVPSAAKAVRDAKARLAALSAPSELSSDHDQLLELLDRLTEVYDSIATAAGAGDADGARTGAIAYRGPRVRGRRGVLVGRVQVPAGPIHSLSAATVRTLMCADCGTTDVAPSMPQAGSASPIPLPAALSWPRPHATGPEGATRPLRRPG